MPNPPPISRELRLMPFRASEAVRRGLLTSNQLRSRAWRRLLPDIYINAAVEPDYRIWCYAAGLAVGDRGALSGLSAAFRWGIDITPRDAEPVEVTVPRPMRMAAAPRLRVIRSVLSPDDVTVTAIRVTTPSRTAFDLARRLPTIEAEVMIDAMLDKGLLTIDSLRSFARTHTRWPGGAAVPGLLDRLQSGRLD